MKNENNSHGKWRLPAIRFSDVYIPVVFTGIVRRRPEECLGDARDTDTICVFILLSGQPSAYDIIGNTHIK